MTTTANCFSTKCATASTPAPKKCSRCKFATYCGETCQQGDWPEHKKWCRPRAESAACSRCQEFPENTLTLHSDDVTMTPEEMREKYAALSSATGKTVVCVSHAPFTASGKSLVRAMAPQGADISSIDTIFFAGSGVHVGRWESNFGRRSLALTFNRQGETCCVCITGTLGYLCGDCKTPTCKDCARELASMEVIEGSRGVVPVPMFLCPVCRQKTYII